MNNGRKRLQSCIELPQEVSSADPGSLGSITIAVPLGGTKRTKEELARQLAEVPIDSVEDMCTKFGVAIEGTIEDEDGRQVPVKIPVNSDETFSPDGLTRSDPKLLGMYVRARANEALSLYLSRQGRGELTEDEIAHLTASLRSLEEALQNEEESDD